MDIEMDDEDDTHICLKCHTTIVGLNNYISHRKNVQCKRMIANNNEKTDINIDHLTIPDNPDYPLRADDFFSSLELQSSTKTSTLNTSRPSATGILTRSKTNAVLLQTSSGSNSVDQTQSNRNEKESSWLGGNYLKDSSGDNQTKLIKAVDNLSANVHKKENSRYQYDLLNDYKSGGGDISNDESEDDDEESEEEDDTNIPPRTHTGGKWKPRASPVQWLHSSEDRSANNDWRSTSPPPSHTGGKWKPTLPTSNTPSPRAHPSREEHSDDDEVPPPNHTKGKWLPGRQNESKRAVSPPNNYTKGKWIPGRESTEQKKYSRSESEIGLLRKSAGTVQYWCGPCNRVLASKIVYDRHLKSDLHKKNTLHETDFEETDMTPNTSNREKRLKKTLNLNYSLDKPKQRISRRQRLLTRCDVCRLKVHIHQMGKHLISHFHWRKSIHQQYLSEKMVFDNIESVVEQSPFQCNLCKFYCNIHESFLNHWQTKLHLENDCKYEGRYWCSYCEFTSKSSNSMYHHFRGQPHQEVIRAINRSVPIIIYKRRLLYCLICSKEFRYNAELRRHCLKNCTQTLTVPTCTASKTYQDVHKCSECERIFPSTISYQLHLRYKHNKRTFFCSKCCMYFETKKQVMDHRNTYEHRFLSVLKSIGNNGKLKKKLQRKCNFCPDILDNVVSLKKHLMEKHLELLPRCPQCGMKFALAQEVTSHLRSKSCAYNQKFPVASNKTIYKCKKCPFKIDSHAEFLFHEALHRGPSSTVKNIKKYKCTFCFKLFRKASLRCHLRLHTLERPYSCDKCDLGFVRKSNLDNHIQNTHNKCNNAESENKSLEEKQQQFSCPVCGKIFKNKYIFRQHKASHQKKFTCPTEGCNYKARSLATLKPHLRIHEDVKAYQCNLCKYATKTQNLLQRHMKIHQIEKGKKCPYCPFETHLATTLRIHIRLHTGAKPYKCPHCSYSSTGLENVRKHVLSTKKHPGKFLYECKFCTSEYDFRKASTSKKSNTDNVFKSNFASEFRKHLSSKHSTEFVSVKAITSYITGIYSSESDPKHTDNPIHIVKEKNSSKAKDKNEATTSVEQATTFNDDMNNTYVLTSQLDLSSSLPNDNSLIVDSNAIIIEDDANDDNNENSVQVNKPNRIASDQNLLHFEVITSTDNKSDDIAYIALPATIAHGWTIGELCYDNDDNDHTPTTFQADEIIIERVTSNFNEETNENKQAKS